MNCEDFKLHKGMSQSQVNELIGGYILLVDDVYNGNNHKHNWKCNCGNKFERRFYNIISQGLNFDCGCVEYNRIEQRYKHEVENTGEYEYIRSYRKGDKLPNGNTVNKRETYLKIKHIHCGRIYEIKTSSFINMKNRCSKCCGSYEKSFAHYIEVELGEPLEKYWDFEKNTVNPYHIWKNYNGKIWIKCQKKDYHGSYEIKCNHFIYGNRCSYCSTRKIHPRDSFGQYLIDNKLMHLWSNKNTLNPFEIARSSKIKVYMICDKVNYHNDYGGYEVSCSNFYHGRRCNYCSSNKIHAKDSFGQWLRDNDLYELWSNKNKINPHSISTMNNSIKIYMLCENKDYHNDKGGYETTCDNFVSGSRCGYCRKHKVHYLDSLGYMHPELLKNWSNKNNIDIYNISPKSGRKCWFICDECSYEWNTWLFNITSHGQWCPKCAKSKGERKISKWLNNNNIVYKSEYKFIDLLSQKGNNLRYDFYLPKYNILIEYDGKQHDKWIKGWMSKVDFDTLQTHDKLKNDYAKNNNIVLLRIKECDYKNIENILEKELL